MADEARVEDRTRRGGGEGEEGRKRGREEEGEEGEEEEEGEEGRGRRGGRRRMARRMYNGTSNAWHHVALKTRGQEIQRTFERGKAIGRPTPTVVR